MKKGIERRSRNRSAIVVHLRRFEGSWGGGAGIELFVVPDNFVASVVAGRDEERSSPVRIRKGSRADEGIAGQAPSGFPSPQPRRRGRGDHPGMAREEKRKLRRRAAGEGGVPPVREEVGDPGFQLKLDQL